MVTSTPTSTAAEFLASAGSAPQVSANAVSDNGFEEQLAGAIRQVLEQAGLNPDLVQVSQAAGSGQDSVTGGSPSQFFVTIQPQAAAAGSTEATAPVTTPVTASPAAGTPASAQQAASPVDPRGGDTYWNLTGKANPYAISADYNSLDAANQVAAILGGTVTDIRQAWVGTPFAGLTMQNFYRLTLNGQTYSTADLAKALNEYSPDFLRVALNDMGISKLGPPPAASPVAYVSDYVKDPAYTGTSGVNTAA